MMDFPSSPTTGQTYSISGGPTYVYNGTAWIVLTPGNQFNRTIFTATAGQTTFSMNYVVGAIDVYRNGVKLAPADFTATNGMSIVLLNAATVGDTIEVISYPMITYSDAVKRTGDTMTGDLTIQKSADNSRLYLNSVGGSGRNYSVLSNSAGNFIVYDVSADNTRFAIDAGGRVLTPNQPAFYAYATSNVNYNTTSTKISVHNVALYNIGNCYSTSTFRFTAPVAGIYYFAVRCWALGGNTTDAGVQFIINGSTNLGMHRIGPSGYFQTLLPNVIVSLSANDYVEIWTETASATGVVHTSSGQYSSFSGYLLG